MHRGGHDRHGGRLGGGPRAPAGECGPALRPARPDAASGRVHGGPSRARRRGQRPLAHGRPRGRRLRRGGTLRRAGAVGADPRGVCSRPAPSPSRRPAIWLAGACRSAPRIWPKASTNASTSAIPSRAVPSSGSSAAPAHAGKGARLRRLRRGGNRRWSSSPAVPSMGHHVLGYLPRKAR